VVVEPGFGRRLLREPVPPDKIGLADASRDEVFPGEAAGAADINDAKGIRRADALPDLISR
jgi:hypothetical protein